MTQIIPTTTDSPTLKPGLSADLQDAIQQFIRTVDVTQTTRDSYRKKLNAFFAWAEKEHRIPLRRGDVVAYKDSMKERRFTAGTISAYLTPIKLLYRFLADQYGVEDVTKGLGKVKKPAGHRKNALTREQVREVMGLIDTDTEAGKRDYAIVNLLFRTGLRTVEVARAQVGDIEQRGEEAILHVHGKGRAEKDAFVVLTPESLKPIYDYLTARGSTKDTDPLFASVSNNSKGQPLTTRAIRGIVKRYFRLAGLDTPKLTTHSARHTFATVALLNGADVMQVKESLRHQSVETTMIYTRVLNRLENAAERAVDY